MVEPCPDSGRARKPSCSGPALTSQRAKELGLDQISGRDHEGGIFLNLERKRILDKLDWTAELDLDNPDAVVLTSLNHRFTINDVWGPGGA